MHNTDPSLENSLIEDLSWREQEVLILLAKRLTNREIGDRLHLAESTVKSHVSNIISKLGVKNRRQVVEKAKKMGLLAPDKKVGSKDLHTLPTEPTPFIGRAEELAKISQLLDGTRLLTLTGTGGVGKTRLALHAASDLRDKFDNGVFFVSLAPISTGEQIIQTIAEAIGFPLSTDEAPIDQLLSYLKRRQLLLVMDNFEHLLNGVNIIARILQEAPKVKIIATSREKLKLHGETVLNITGMNFPGQETSSNPQGDDAIKLFLHSIHRVLPQFDPDVDDLKHLIKICQLVEGMPLAIELAAGWMNVLSPVELASEIQRGLDILSSEIRDIPERHRSMRTVFDQSWSFLDQPERDAFMRLSAFRGGFTREAAEEVAGASLQLLANLVNKSFLRHDPTSGRFDTHELLREYAHEQLGKTPDDKASASKAHATYFANFMEERWDQLRDQRQKTALKEIGADLENIRTAWHYFIDQEDAVQLQKFLNSFWLVHWFLGWNHAGEKLFGEVVEALSQKQGEEERAARAVALAYQSFFKTWLGFAEQGYRLAKESVDSLEHLDRPFDLVLAMGCLNLAADFLTHYEEGETVARKMLDYANRMNDKWLLAFSLYKVSVANPLQRDYSETKRVAQTSLDLYDELGETMASMLTLMTLGHAALALGEHTQARELYLRCLKTSEGAGYRWGIANASKYLGLLALSFSDPVAAESYLLRSLKIADETGSGRDQVNLLCDLAKVRRAEGQLEKAVELAAVVLQHPASDLHRLGGGSIRGRVQELLDTLKSELSAEAYEAAWGRGNAQLFDQVVSDLISNP